MSGEAVLRVTFPFHKACDICHKTMKSLYRIELDGIPVYVCSGEHAIVARDRWQDKKNNNMIPQVPDSIEEPEMDDGGLPEEGGEE